MAYNLMWRNWHDCAMGWLVQENGIITHYLPWCIYQSAYSHVWPIVVMNEKQTCWVVPYNDYYIFIHHCMFSRWARGLRVCWLVGWWKLAPPAPFCHLFTLLGIIIIIIIIRYLKDFYYYFLIWKRANFICIFVRHASIYFHKVVWCR